MEKRFHLPDFRSKRCQECGKQFLECFKQAIAKVPDTKHPEHSIHNALRLFEPDFIDSDDTIIIIDEIQESAAIYNCIQNLGYSFQSRFILISSYPGQLLKPKFLPYNEDGRKIAVYTLSFDEFLQAYDERLYS
jgi:predicted AAA+ superfamily ATPase